MKTSHSCQLTFLYLVSSDGVCSQSSELKGRLRLSNCKSALKFLREARISLKGQSSADLLKIWCVDFLSHRHLCEFPQWWNICPAHAQRGQKAEGRVRPVCCGIPDCARPHERSKLSSASRLGRRGAALQIRDRGGDQTGPDGLQSQLRQRQPGQVRPQRPLLWDGGDQVA